MSLTSCYFRLAMLAFAVDIGLQAVKAHLVNLPPAPRCFAPQTLHRPTLTAAARVMVLPHRFW
jgi:hypothetical protein